MFSTNFLKYMHIQKSDRCLIMVFTLLDVLSKISNTISYLVLSLFFDNLKNPIFSLWNNVTKQAFTKQWRKNWLDSNNVFVFITTSQDSIKKLKC